MEIYPQRDLWDRPVIDFVLGGPPIPKCKRKRRSVQCTCCVISAKSDVTKLCCGINLEKEKPLESTESIVKLKWPYAANRAELRSANRKSQVVSRLPQTFL